MKKLLKIITGVTLGLAMAVGVSVGVANNRNTKAAYADTSTVTFSSGFSGTYNSNTPTSVSWTSTHLNILQERTSTETTPANYTTAPRWYQGNTITFTPVDCTITQMVFTWTGTYSRANDTWSAGSASTNDSQKTTTWSGSASSAFTLVAGAQFRPTQIALTYSTGGSGGPVALTNPNPQYNDLNKTVSWTTDANATKYQIKVDTGEYADINTETYNASGLSVGEQHTVYIKAVGDGENYSSTEGSVQFTPTAPFVSKEYALCTSVADLEVGAKYIFTNGISGDVKTMSTESNNNNRKITSVSVDGTSHRITSTQQTLVVELGGSEDNWTFETTNYLGTDGYFASGTGDNNHLKIMASAGTAAISFDGNAALVVIGPHDSRNVIKYNTNNTFFSCYTSNYTTNVGSVYLWKEFKELSSLNVTGTPNKLTGYYDSEAFDPTGITAYEAVYSDTSTKALSASDIVWPDLTAGMTTIKGSYTEFGTTVYTPTYNITVSADSLSTISLSGTMTTHYYMDESWDKGSLVVTATYSSGQQNIVTNDSALTYYSNSSMTAEVATPAALGAGTNQTIYVKATYETVSNTTGYAQTVTVEIEHGSVQGDPLTVAEAVTIGNALAHNAQTSKQYYIFGVVSQIDDNKLSEANNYATFYLQNGDVAQGFQVYQIAPDNSCTNYTDFKVGAEVLIKCQIKRYNSTIETGAAKSLLSITYNAPELTGITLNKNSLLLGVGEEFELTVSPNPIGAELGVVSWNSSNSDVAMVVDGTVTAVAPGSAIITVEAGGFSATCNVIVSLKDTMKYNTAETTSMSTSGNASLVNLDPALFSVDSSKGTNNYFPGLNKDNDIRVNIDNTVIVTIDSNYTIIEIHVSYKANAASSEIFVGSTEVTGNAEGTYAINSNSFRIHASGSQVKINSVDIFYRNATTAEKVSRLNTQSSLAYSDYTNNGDETFTYDNLGIRFGGTISSALWSELSSEVGGITGYGVLLTDDSIGSDTIEDYYNVFKTNENTVDEALAEMCSGGTVTNYSSSNTRHETPAKAAPSVVNGNYTWRLYYRIAEANRTDTLVAVAYIRTSTGIIFLQEERTSVKELATDLIANETYGANPFGGSLSYLARP